MICLAFLPRGGGGELDGDRLEAVMNIDVSAAGGAGGFESQPGPLEHALGVIALNAFGDADAN